MQDLGFHFQSVLLAACIFITTGFLDFSFPLLKQEGGKDVRSPKFLSSLAGLAHLGLDAEWVHKDESGRGTLPQAPGAGSSLGRGGVISL